MDYDTNLEEVLTRIKYQTYQIKIDGGCVYFWKKLKFKRLVFTWVLGSPFEAQDEKTKEYLKQIIKD